MGNDNKVVFRAGKTRKKKKIIKIIKLALFILMLILLIIYIVVSVIYNNGNFSITLDRRLYTKNSIIIYDDPNYKIFRTELYAETLDHFDNISYKWLPKDIDSYEDGSHNGDNYVAYTFYIENLGEETADYWSEIVIDDVLKNVDEAIRIRVYKDGIYTTYAKASSDGSPEANTVSFLEDDIVSEDHVEDFNPGDKNKYTIVLWLEGSDPECNDNILGGQIKIHMNFNSEIIKK